MAKTLKHSVPVKSPPVDCFIEVLRGLLCSFVYVLVIEEKLAKFATWELCPDEIVLLNMLVPQTNARFEFLETGLNRRSKPGAELLEFIEILTDDAGLVSVQRRVLLLTGSLESKDPGKLMGEGSSDFIT